MQVYKKTVKKSIFQWQGEMNLDTAIKLFKENSTIVLDFSELTVINNFKNVMEIGTCKHWWNPQVIAKYIITKAIH